MAPLVNQHRGAHVGVGIVEVAADSDELGGDVDAAERRQCLVGSAWIANDPGAAGADDRRGHVGSSRTSA